MMQNAGGNGKRERRSGDPAGQRTDGGAITPDFLVLAEALPQIVWVHGRDGKLEFINQRGLAYAGLSAGSVASRTLAARLLHPADRGRARDAWREAQSRGAGYSLEARLRRADGVYHWHRVQAHPMRDGSGPLMRWMGMAADVHDVKEREERSAFLLSLSTELARIADPQELVCTAMARLHERLATSRATLAELDHEEGEAILLTQGDEDPGRIEIATLPLASFDLLALHSPESSATVVRDARRAARAASLQASEPGPHAEGALISVPLLRGGHPVALPLDGDLTRLSQLVANLLINAAKYTPEGGHIWIEAEKHENAVTLRVRDTGMGIAPDLLPHIFDLFTQGTRTLDRAQGGLGIGLTLVRKIVEMHGGRVEARSAGAGQGSELIVRLPLLRGRAAVAREPQAPSAAAAGGSRTRVLVVDDNVDAADSIAMLLSLEGHEVVSVHAAHEALEAAQTFRPHVVLLDIGLPGMDGYEVARRLRSRQRIESMRLVAITGYGQQSDRERAREAGFDEHLVKPVDPDALRELLGSMAVTGPDRAH